MHPLSATARRSMGGREAAQRHTDRPGERSGDRVEAPDMPRASGRARSCVGRGAIRRARAPRSHSLLRARAVKRLVPLPGAASSPRPGASGPPEIPRQGDRTEAMNAVRGAKRRRELWEPPHVGVGQLPGLVAERGPRLHCRARTTRASASASVGGRPGGLGGAIPLASPRPPEALKRGAMRLAGGSLSAGTGDAGHTGDGTSRTGLRVQAAVSLPQRSAFEQHDRFTDEDEFRAGLLPHGLRPPDLADAPLHPTGSVRSRRHTGTESAAVVSNLARANR
jgi:hypothetical protein